MSPQDKRCNAIIVTSFACKRLQLFFVLTQHIGLRSGGVEWQHSPRLYFSSATPTVMIKSNICGGGNYGPSTSRTEAIYL